MTSWTTLPLLSLTATLTSRRARRCASMSANLPMATAANAVYSPSVPNSQG
jgi:hypothetical protein